jgi:hypothetical protein
MKTWWPYHVFALTCWLTFVPSIHAQGAGACRALDKGGQANLDWVRATATGSDSTAIRARIATAIPSASSSQISYVTDAKLCQQAVAAYSSAAQVTATGRSVYLVKVSSMYVITDPTVKPGEWWLSMTADRKFAIVRKFMS